MLLVLAEQQVGEAVRALPTVSDRTHLSCSRLCRHQELYRNGQGLSRESIPVVDMD